MNPLINRRPLVAGEVSARSAALATEHLRREAAEKAARVEAAYQAACARRQAEREAAAKAAAEAEAAAKAAASQKLAETARLRNAALIERRERGRPAQATAHRRSKKRR